MINYTVIVSSENGKITKYAEFETLAEAENHVSTYGGFVYNGEYQQNMIVSDDNTISFDSNWETNRLAEVMRGFRDVLLQETDWWAVGDRTMTQEERDYRQSLRDITSHANWPNLQETDWPTKP